MIIVSDIVTLRDRGKYQGILGAALGMGNVIGPFIAAAFVMDSTWRGFFWLISPLSACSIVVGYFLIPNNARKDSLRKNARKIDYYGILSSSIGIIFLLIPISGGGSYFNWDSAMVISMLTIAGCALIAFLIIEWKVAVLPMLPMVFFKNRVVCTLFLQSFLFGAVYQSSLYYLPLYYQNARDWSPIVSAALTAPMVACQSVASVLSGQYISRRKRYGEVIWAGFFFWTLGAGLMLLFDRHTSPGAIAVIVGIAGIGVGGVFQPTMVAFQAHCTKAQRAVVISDRNFFRCLGGACGLAISAAILQATLRSNLPVGYRDIADSSYSLPSRAGIPDADWEQILDAYAKASHSVFIFQVPLMGVCLLACVFIRDRGLERPKDQFEIEEEKRQEEEKRRQEQAQEQAEKQVAAGDTEAQPEQVPESQASGEMESASRSEKKVEPEPVTMTTPCAPTAKRPGRYVTKPPYTRALQDRIAYLESQLESKPMSSRASSHVAHPVAALLSPPHPETPSNPAPGLDQNAVGELVGFLALNSSEAPAYVGSSSGLSLATNLGEMVQATIWNQALSSARAASSGRSGPAAGQGSTGLPPQPPGERAGHVNDRTRPPRVEEVLVKSSEPPSDEMGSRILHAYLTRIHVRYPFLDRTELWRLHEARWRLAQKKREELTKEERVGIFKLYLVYAIGATSIQLSETYSYTTPERFYMTALQQLPNMCEMRSIENIEAMALLIVYHLRSASGQGMWYMVGLAMRTAIDLGLHRKANEINMDPFTAQMRRRLFWTVYYLERVVSMSLGRPFSIADRHIDLPLPADIDDDVRDPALLAAPPAPTRITTLTFAIFLMRLRRIDSEIQHKIYRADRPLHTLRSKMDRLFLQLEEWKESALRRFTGSDLDYPMLHYHRALRLLIQPFLPSLPLSDPYYHICLRAAGNTCQTHKKLHQTLEYGHSFLAVQTIFMAGITLLYALWTHTSDVWSVQMSNDIRACSTVLFVMGERAEWVKKYRDAFELLVNAAMEKLEGSDASKKVGMAELMTAQHSSSGGINAGMFRDHHNLTTTCNNNNNPTGGMAPDMNNATANTAAQASSEPTSSQDHGVRMALQIAPWIDLEEDSPFWMPDFETLESLSGNLWDSGDLAPFGPL
ncbi:C6 transcription factor [Aspergillus eucalypticola CBS 122712]|uniref:C6 transcription factor n=1 Tax=Aspergillus eucalypticola (strain CBS 122712 / IBT 29274) TaxID=1448314 RepID=A0A317UXA7_ASPEC|nr:C6 transcription factor [Aspergillus eucalypticola CBS 122712]PWY65132.1 C6 transcription factor [Aspergillus eucalypticola CBS 122712]